MNFEEIAVNRQSCRKFNSSKEIEHEKILSILQIANLSPSACNSQPYRITVCSGNTAKLIAKEVQGMGLNKFAYDAPVFMVISEASYNSSAAMGAKLKGNDYRSVDIGILCAYITAQATALGIGSCIMGWFNDKNIRKICSLESPVRLVIALGYPVDEYPLRNKKRKSIDELADFLY